MLILSWIAQLWIFTRRIWRRFKMLILRPAFGHHGTHFIFDPDDHFNYGNIKVGNDVSIGSGAVFLVSDSRLIIGNKVMFGPNVTIVGGDHNTSAVGKYMYDVHEKQPGDDLDVIFEDDIWVGTGAIILKGVRVGRGSIIAAGALVNKDVLPYAIVAGIPARQISTRFREISTVVEHEAILYPPEKRMDIKVLEKSFNHD